ncbi:MAG: hypothetical protein OEY78_07225 [Gammaproteobacteria bacterium]|nr:hypothetical protein [Gammaproteobacteria bacterium]
MTEKLDDHEWSQIRETVLIINVAVARIKHAMTDGDDSVSILSQSFIDMVKSAQQITNDAKDIEASPARDKIDKECMEISRQIQNSVIAFQFYDKLSQRMGLISEALNSLTEVLKDSSKTHEQEEWKNLQDTIRLKYTLDSDQEMFDAVINGMSIEEALKIAVEKTSEHEIEFF